MISYFTKIGHRIERLINMIDTALGNDLNHLVLNRQLMLNRIDAFFRERAPSSTGSESKFIRAIDKLELRFANRQTLLETYSSCAGGVMKMVSTVDTIRQLRENFDLDISEAALVIEIFHQLNWDAAISAVAQPKAPVK